MKKICRYLVIDLKTGYALSCGNKYIDLEKSPVRRVWQGEWRLFPCFWRKVTEYFRTVTIKGRECVIFYWFINRREKLGNYVYPVPCGPFTDYYFLRGRGYFSGVYYCRDLLETCPFLGWTE